MTAGEPNKGKKDECAQISLKMNKCHTDSAVTVAVTAPQRRPAPREQKL